MAVYGGSRGAPEENLNYLRDVSWESQKCLRDVPGVLQAVFGGVMVQSALLLISLGGASLGLGGLSV